MPPDHAPQGGHDKKFAFTVNDVTYRVADGSLEGDDIRRYAGLVPPSEHVLIQIKRPGTTSIGLEDPVDLTDGGTEEFRAWPSDRTYNFTLDEIGCEWGEATVTEADLRNISGVGDDKDFYLDRTGAAPRLIDEQNPVDLNPRGTEHLRSRPAVTTIIINGEAHTVEGRRISFETLVQMTFNPVPSGPNILITIDYGKGPKQNPKGSLTRGHSVVIANGMVFDVTATDRS